MLGNPVDLFCVTVHCLPPLRQRSPGGGRRTDCLPALSSSEGHVVGLLGTREVALDESLVRSARSSQELHLVGHYVQAVPRLALRGSPASRPKATAHGYLLALDEVRRSRFSLGTEAHGVDEQCLLVLAVTVPLGV